ncbi:MAG: DNA polymerase IV [Candidatus Diapherotrites archaeon]|nr:DNA polymerase IV [Candidatus Diapherotrites archaeon]
MPRIILHIDLDYFYAQLEELRNPKLKGRPLVVGMYSGRTETSGAVATCNYEARALGIHSGMPLAFAKKRANAETAFLKADRDHYKKVSDRIMAIFRKNADAFEQVSIDEAYLDVSQRADGKIGEGKKIAEHIKAELLQKEKLTCSVGVASNKMVAKIASGFKKPAGLTVIEAGHEKEFLFPMPADKIPGIGPKTSEALAEKGVKTVKDLHSFSLARLEGICGEKRALLFKEFAEGRDSREVEEHERKQLSRIGTMKKDAVNAKDVAEFIEGLAEDLHKRVQKQGVSFKTVSIIGISDKLESFSRAKTLEAATDGLQAINATAKELFERLFEQNRGLALRRAGISLSGLSEKEVRHVQGAKTQKSLGDFT